MVYKDLYKKMEEICLRSSYFREDTDYTAEGPFQGWTLVGREALTVHLLHLGGGRGRDNLDCASDSKMVKILKQKHEETVIINHFKPWVPHQGFHQGLLSFGK